MGHGIGIMGHRPQIKIHIIGNPAWVDVFLNQHSAYTNWFFSNVFLFVKAAELAKLRERYADDPDAVFTANGLHFIGPKGRIEDETTHLRRLAHNARMRFNRSFTGLGFQNFLLASGPHMCKYTTCIQYLVGGNCC